MNITRIAVVLLCLWGALEGSSLKRSINTNQEQGMHFPVIKLEKSNMFNLLEGKLSCWLGRDVKIANVVGTNPDGITEESYKDIFNNLLRTVPPLFVLTSESPELVLVLLLSLIIVIAPGYILIKNNSARKKWIWWVLPPAAFFFILSWVLATNQLSIILFRYPLILMARVVFFLFSLSVFIFYLMNTPQKRQIWSKWFLLVVSGCLLAFVIKGIAGPWAVLVSLLCVPFLIILSISFVIHGIQWLLQRHPNWKGLILSLLNTLGCFEVIAIFLIPFVGFSGEASIVIAMGYYPIASAAVMGTAAYAVLCYINSKKRVMEPIAE